MEEFAMDLISNCMFREEGFEEGKVHLLNIKSHLNYILSGC